MKTVEVSFKKSFVGTSNNGLTFHWLRSTYSGVLEEAIDHAVRLVYSPSVLAASPDTWGKVSNEVAYCRDGFREMMALVSNVLAPDCPLPKRVNIAFEGSYPTESNLGKVYEWLLNAFSDPEKAIFHAIRVIYFPAALAASPNICGDPSIQAERSRLLFEQRMKLAIWQSNPTEAALIANRLDKTFLASVPDDPLRVTQIPKSGSLPLSTSATAGFEIADDDDFDDDFVDVDRTLDLD
ncbi:MAG: hypothetical protein WCD18_06775 [Thermosynechococcaceae cyanobacterium]